MVHSAIVNFFRLKDFKSLNIENVSTVEKSYPPNDNSINGLNWSLDHEIDIIPNLFPHI